MSDPWFQSKRQEHIVHGTSGCVATLITLGVAINLAVFAWSWFPPGTYLPLRLLTSAAVALVGAVVSLVAVGVVSFLVMAVTSDWSPPPTTWYQRRILWPASVFIGIAISLCVGLLLIAYSRVWTLILAGPLVAWCLYLLRCKRRALYGSLEFLFGALQFAFVWVPAYYAEVANSPPEILLQRGHAAEWFRTVAAIYFMVRGFDNISTGLGSTPFGKAS